MAITLDWEVKPATKISTNSSETVQLSVGQSLKVETTPNGEEVLNIECPEGEIWNARVTVQIIVV